MNNKERVIRVGKQPKKESGSSNLEKVSYRRSKINEPIYKTETGRVFPLPFNKKIKKPQRVEELKVIIELLDERVDLVSFVESVINFKSEGNDRQSTD